jgi:hypothetical protein
MTGDYADRMLSAASLTNPFDSFRADASDAFGRGLLTPARRRA